MTTASRTKQIYWSCFFLLIAATPSATTAVELDPLFNSPFGIYCYATLVPASNGDLYGTAVSDYGSGGTVFRITTGGAFTTVAHFNSTNGFQLYAGLVLGSDGNFYGAAYSGGTSNYGTIFMVTTNGLFTKLADFAGTNGANPFAALIQTEDGVLYGTTQNGGTFGNGTIFRVTTGGVLQSMVSFPDNAHPLASLAAGPDGALYGTSNRGGNYGYGSVFRVTTNGTFTNLFDFNQTNGSFLGAGLTLGQDGQFYGTTVRGGTYDEGTVFRIDTSGNLATLFSFLPKLGNGMPTNATGAEPYASPVFGPDGYMYGTAHDGGASGNGTLFRITTNGELTTLYSFGPTFDPHGTNTTGAHPWAGLTFAADGNWYGSTFFGGFNNQGVIFRLRSVYSANLPLSLQFGVPGPHTNSLSCIGPANAEYVLQSTTNLASGAWFSLCTNLSDGSGLWTAVDDSATNDQRFYRLTLPY